LKTSLLSSFLFYDDGIDESNPHRREKRRGEKRREVTPIEEKRGDGRRGEKLPP
jgi:hypothetical protein